MAGGRSLGCKTCKARRIKCDEQKPVCKQCEKSNRKCSGPLAPFIYEPQMEKAGHCQPLLERALAAQPRDVRWKVMSLNLKDRSECDRAQSKDEMHTFLGRRSRGKLNRPQSPPLARPWLICQSEALGFTLSKILETTKGTGYSLNAVEEFMRHLPSVIGHDEALDAAVESLLFSQGNVIHHQQFVLARHLKLYGSALKKLKDSVKRSNGQVNFLMVAAVLVLCMVECLSSQDDAFQIPTTWMTHMSGVESLFRSLGPERLTSELEKDMLFYQAPQIIAACLISGTRCFLEKREWTAVTMKKTTSLSGDRIHIKLHAINVALPGLMVDIKNSAVCGNDVFARAWRLRQQILDVAPDVEAFLRCTAYVSIVSSEDPTSPFKRCYRFSDNGAGQAICFYWRLMIIINHNIQMLRLRPANRCPLPEMDLRRSTIDAAKGIAMSLESVRQWVPIAHIPFLCSLPIAHFVYATYGQDIDEFKDEAEWIMCVSNELMPPHNPLLNSMSAQLKHAVGLCYPDLSI